MRGNRASGTRPELQVRRALHGAGLRYRVQHPVPGNRRRRIDVAFTRLRIAVSVDGCFWHGCDVHRFRPKRNADYWHAKFAKNGQRDAATDLLLEQAGWLVLRFWEHEPVEQVLAAVVAAVTERRAALAIEDRPGAERALTTLDR